MTRGREGRNAGDPKSRAPGARDPGAHLDEHGAQVHDLRFTRGIVDSGVALCEDSSHEDVLGGTHRREGQPDRRAVQFVRLGNDAAMLDGAVRPQQTETGLVHVERAGADRVSARQGDHRAAASRDQGSEDTYGGTELLHRSEVRVVRRLRGGRDPYFVTVEFDLAAETPQDLRHQGHVEDVWTVRNRRGALGEKRGSHQLEHAVLGTTDDDITNEPVSPGDKKAFTHSDTA